MAKQQTKNEQKTTTSKATTGEQIRQRKTTHQQK